MTSFTRYEITGITITILIVIVIFGAVRFFNAEEVDPGEVLALDNDEIIALPEQDVHDTANFQALLDGVTGQGRVTNLIIQDVMEGEGDEVENGDEVDVHYIGILDDGTPFDNSYERNRPITFTVGEGTVIEGWDRGLLGMKKGGQRILVIPSDQAYGNNAVGNIPPNATLLFAVELVEVR